MKYIETYITKKFDICNINFHMPKFYKSIKDETKMSYLLLNYMYYKKYNKFINMDNINKDKMGKPIFLNNNLYFNISHSNNYTSCCLATVNVGIDIEEDRIIKETTLKKILNENDKDIEYIKIWNIKEAYSKYLGIGLKLNFSKISINEIKQNVNLINNIYSINNKNLYFSLCYNTKEENIYNNIDFIDSNKLIKFYSLT